MEDLQSAWEQVTSSLPGLEVVDISPGRGHRGPLFPVLEHDVVYLQGRLFLFGGKRSDRSSELWIYDLGTFQLNPTA